MSSIFGKKFTVSLFGDGNSDVVGAVIEGIPTGFAPDIASLKTIGEYKIISGMYQNRCSGTPLCVLFPTPQQPKLTETVSPDIVRPGLDDLGEFKKAGGKMTLRNGRHYAFLLQQALLFAGELACQLLKEKDIYIYSHILQLSEVRDQSFAEIARLQDILPALSKGELPVIDKRKEMLMKLAVTQAQNDGDTLGGKIEATVTGLAAGVGDAVFAGLKSRLSEALFSLPQICALEFGKGVNAAAMTGSKYNDIPFVDTTRGMIVTQTNHCGGIEGSMSNGMPLLLTATFAPSPYVAKSQPSVHRSEQRGAALPPFESAVFDLETKNKLVRAAIAITIIDILE